LTDLEVLGGMFGEHGGSKRAERLALLDAPIEAIFHLRLACVRQYRSVAARGPLCHSHVLPSMSRMAIFYRHALAIVSKDAGSGVRTTDDRHGATENRDGSARRCGGMALDPVLGENAENSHYRCRVGRLPRAMPQWVGVSGVSTRRDHCRVWHGHSLDVPLRQGVRS
jgi:hypothetical protein